MTKKIFAISLSALLLMAFGVQSTLAQTASGDQRVQEVSMQVAKLGTGKKAKVHVKLRDNTKIKGYISDAGQDSFTVVDSNGPRTIAYGDVTEVRKQQGGISPLTWGILGGAAAAVAIVAVTVVKPVLCDGGAGC